MRLARVAAVALALTGALATDAAAHARDPYIVDIHFKFGDAQHVIAGTTFGLVISTDGGVSWRWICEQALHYQDPYDPDYAYGVGGEVLMQSFTGVRVAADACTFTETPLGMTFVSRVAAGSDGALYAAASDTGDVAIYKSIDSGATFPLSVTPGASDWWESIEVSPVNPQRIYLSGYRQQPVRTQLLYRSDNGGASYAPISTTGIVTTEDSTIDIVGIGPAADTVYIRVARETASGGDAIYKSTNAGGSWMKILATNDFYGLAFLARSNGQLIAATRTSGTQKSDDGGTTWDPVATAPHISTLAESPTGEIWAGTQTYTTADMGPFPSVTSDGYAIMKSTDLASWSPVFSVKDLLEPVSCAPVHQVCQIESQGFGTPWCCLVVEIGITGSLVDCSGFNACGGFKDAPPAGGDVTMRPVDSCCGVGTGSAPWGLVLGVVGLAWQVFRRRRP